MLAVFLITLFACIFGTVPIFVSLVVTALAMVLFSGDAISFELIARQVFAGTNSFSLLAIPFFLMAGEVMNMGGMSKRIVRFCSSLIGHVKGGIGYVAVLACMLFAGVSGAAVADTSAVGSVMLPIMEEEKYDKPTCTALICSAGCIGPIIPPSIPMIVYGVTVGESISKLFIGGIIPGIMIGLGLMAVWCIYVKKLQLKPRKRASLHEVLDSTKDAIWALMLPVIILGGILTGIATATESSVVALVYAIIIGKFVYRELKWKDLPEIFINSIAGSASLMIVVGTATAAAYMITIEQIPQSMTAALCSISTNPYIILLLINLLLLAIGCVMDATPTMLILAPILTPLIQSMGLSPIWFGVVMTVNICIGLLTPPVGCVLYAGANLAKLPPAKVIKAMLPYLLVMTVVLFAITYFPGIVMLLPNMMK